MRLEQERASLPDGYAEAEAELLPWSHVDQRMREARHYWLASVSQDGSPHTRPVGGMWLDDKLYLGGSPQSKWMRNVLAEPRACVSLSEENEGDRAVVLHGRVAFIHPDRELAEHGSTVVSSSDFT